MNTRQMMIENVRQSRLLTERTMHFDDYVSEMLNFQNAIFKIAFGTESGESIRVDDTIVRLYDQAKENGVQNDPTFRKGIGSLRKLHRELAISISGVRSENKVAKALEYVERGNVSTFRNIYLSGGGEEAELDNVVLTSSGVIVLEVKTAKDDVTISEEGRLFHGDDQCYEKQPIGMKMADKRRLLAEAIERELGSRGASMNVKVDSVIVFAVPKGVHIRINDCYRKEKYCRHGKLPYMINDYTSDVEYTNDEMGVLHDVLAGLEASRKGFDVKIDFNEVFDDFVGMLDVLENAPVKPVNGAVGFHGAAKADRRNRRSRMPERMLGRVAAATIAFGTKLDALSKRAS